MLISELKNNIVNGNISNFYIFTGEEEGIMSIFISQIMKKKGLTLKWADSVAELKKVVNLKSLVGVKYLYLVRQDNAFKSQETLWSFVKNDIVGHYVILIQPSLDKKTKVYNYFQDRIIQFDKLSSDMLSTYGRKRCPQLSANNLIKLIEWCGFSYFRMMNELDKVWCLANTRNISLDQSFNAIDADGGFFKEQDFDIMKFVNFVMTRDKHACFQYADKVKELKNELALVALLKNSFLNLFLLKSDGGGKGVCDRTGMTGWQVKCAIEVSQYYNTQESERILRFLNALEIQIKTGAIDTKNIIDFILVEVL